MAQLFTQSVFQTKFASNDRQKKLFAYHEEIRKRNKQQQINELRQLVRIKRQINIEIIIQNLPNSLQDIVNFLQSYDSIQRRKVVSRLIIKKIYQNQTKNSESQTNYEISNADNVQYLNENNIDQIDQSKKKFILFKAQKPENIKTLSQQFYLFNTILQTQGLQTKILIQKYFFVLFDHAIYFNVFQFLFSSISIILSNSDLNWIPIQQIIHLIKYIQKQKIKQIHNQEIAMYYQLSKNYINLVFSVQEIKVRVQDLFSKSYKIIQNIKSTTFIKFCINLTFHEKYQNPQQNISQINCMTFHKCLLQGKIFKIIYRNIFYSSKTKLRLLCLDLLRNFICEYGSQMLWNQHKLNPIELIQKEIRNKENDFRTFEAFSELFLISILKLPTKNELLENITQGQLDTISLIQYILEIISESYSERKEKIKELIVCCLELFLDLLQKQKRQKMANKLLLNEWRKYLDEQDNLYQKVKNIVQKKD